MAIWKSKMVTICIDLAIREGKSQVHAKMVIKDASAYRDIAFGGSLGGGEAYMLDKWSTPNMLEAGTVDVYQYRFPESDGPLDARCFSVLVTSSSTGSTAIPKSRRATIFRAITISVMISFHCFSIRT